MLWDPVGGERTVEAVPTPSREAVLFKVPRGSPALLIKRQREPEAEKHSNIPSAYTEEIEPNWIFAWYEHACRVFR